MIHPDTIQIPDTAGGTATLELTGDPLASANRVISAGLCDLQVNGFAGIDFNDPKITADDLHQALATMLATGVTCCLPTVITGSGDWLHACFTALERARLGSGLATQMIAGYHLEGPFLNPGQGYSGCHPADAMCAPTWDLFESLQQSANGMIRLITIAPEMPGALELIPRWIDQGVTVAVGHTCADYETLLGATAAGATLSTHLGNGLPRSLNKSDNPLFSQLSNDGLTASFIADGYHLRPHVLGIYLRAKQAKRTILVTDGTSGSGATAGRYTLGQISIQRAFEEVVYLPGTTNLAGSATTLDTCVRNVMNWYAVPLATAINWASEQPRELIGLPAQPDAGEAQSRVEWERTDDGWFVVNTRLGEHSANAL